MTHATLKPATPATAAYPGQVTLTMTQAQAETLRAVCARIGGHPATRRGDMEAISDALDRAGVIKLQVSLTAGLISIYFA